MNYVIIKFAVEDISFAFAKEVMEVLAEEYTLTEKDDVIIGSLVMPFKRGLHAIHLDSRYDAFGGLLLDAKIVPFKK